MEPVNSSKNFKKQLVLGFEGISGHNIFLVTENTINKVHMNIVKFLIKITTHRVNRGNRFLDRNFIILLIFIVFLKL